jgi:hypothetical protein
MILTLVEMVIPAVFVLTTLFGVLSRADPKPGGVALFLRVGLVGSGIGAAVWYAVWRAGVTGPFGDALRNGTMGLVAFGGLLVLMGAFGAILKRGP